MGLSDDPNLKAREQVFYLEDLPDDVVIAEGALDEAIKKAWNTALPLKLNGEVIGGVIINEDNEFQAEIDPALLDEEQRRAFQLDDWSLDVQALSFSNVFDQDDTNPGDGQKKPPFRLPGR